MKEINKLQENYIISFSDFLRICKTKKWTIILSALIFALISSLIALTKPVEYVVKGTFKEKGIASSGLNQNNNVFFMGMSFSNNVSNNETISIMYSRKLLEQVILKLKMQGTLTKKGVGFDILKKICQNCLVEYAYFQKKLAPVLQDNHPDLIISEVSYSKEIPSSFSLEFITESSYQVFDNRDKLIGVGELGKPFLVEDSSFTIVQNEPHQLKGQKYSINLLPILLVANVILKQLIIETDLRDKHLLHIKYSHHDRHFAALFINTLMSVYQHYLRKEQNRITDEQLVYLQSRQQKISKDLKEMMEAYAQGLSSDISNTGFSDSKRAVEYLSNLQNSLMGKFLEIDFELKRLQNAQNEGYAYFDSYGFLHGDSMVINQLLTEIRQLKQQADSIKLALNHESKEQETQQENSEFQGIDLVCAGELFVKYSSLLHEVETQIRQFQFTYDQLLFPEFEVSSLSHQLRDPVSNEMIMKTTNLVLSLKDENNRSTKEQERLKNEITLQKKFLLMHVKQTIDLLMLNETVLKEKIKSLQKETLAIINQKIGIIKKHFQEYLSVRLKDLKQEKSIIEEHQLQIKKEMTTFPSKWVSEKFIDLQMDLYKKMVEEVSSMVESKNISANLEVIQSAPIDLALPTIHPQSPRLIFFLILGAIMGTCFGVSFIVTKSIFTGIKASKENLKLSHQHVSGFITQAIQKNSQDFLDSDLETLRRLTSFLCHDQTETTNEISQHQSLLIVKGRGVDYSSCLAELLVKKGLKVLLMPITFDLPAKENDLPGLLQYLEGKSEWPKIEKKRVYDLMSHGGISRFGTEMIGSASCKKLMNQLKVDYDWIISVTNATPTSVEAETTLKLFDHGVINVTNENVSDLKHYFNMNEESITKNRLSFIFTDIV